MENRVIKPVGTVSKDMSEEQNDKAESCRESRMIKRRVVGRILGMICS